MNYKLSYLNIFQMIIAVSSLLLGNAFLYEGENSKDLLPILLSLIIIVVSGVLIGFMLSIKRESKKKKILIEFKNILRTSLIKIEEPLVNEEVFQILIEIEDKCTFYIKELGDDDLFEFGGAPILSIIHRIIESSIETSPSNKMESYEKQQLEMFIKRLLEKSSLTVSYLDAIEKVQDRYRKWLQLTSLLFSILMIFIYFSTYYL